METLKYFQGALIFTLIYVILKVVWDIILGKLPYLWCKIKHKSRHSMPSQDNNSHLTKRKDTVFLWDNAQNDTVYNKLKIRAEAKNKNEQK